MNPAALIALFVLLTVCSLIGGLILRASISLFNKLARTRGKALIPEPAIPKAVGITLATFIVNVGVGLLIGMLLGGTAQLLGKGPTYPRFVAGTVSSVAAILTMVVMLALSLPTSLPRALLVTLCNYVISFAIAFFLAVVASLFLVVT